MKTKVGNLDCFAVEPITNCPHLNPIQYENFKKVLEDSLSSYHEASNVFDLLPCGVCDEKKENWVCLECGITYCSRYMHGHMVSHNVETGHPVAQSFSDGSFWCYSCDSYITNRTLDRLRKVFGHIKHRLVIESKLNFNDDPRLNSIIEKFTELNLSEKNKGFTQEDLIEGLKNNFYQKICAITGAGISVAAGIPDFRSEGGLYHKLAEEYGVKSPEELMTLNFFKENPEPLYKIMKEFLSADIKPTACHRFFAQLNQQNKLHMYYTQNIDGLEIEAGIDEEHMLQAHGHTKTCSCSNLDCKGNIYLIVRTS